MKKAGGGKEQILKIPCSVLFFSCNINFKNYPKMLTKSIYVKIENSKNSKNCKNDAKNDEFRGPARYNVSCGNHKAASCEACPQGRGARWCKGDCYWNYNRCSPKRGNNNNLTNR